MGFIGGSLSLMLVFRTNTAYNRFSEGKKIMDTVASCSRQIATFVSAYPTDLGYDRQVRIAALLCAYPVATVLYLKGELYRLMRRESMPRALALSSTMCLTRLLSPATYTCKRSGIQPEDPANELRYTRCTCAVCLRHLYVGAW